MKRLQDVLLILYLSCIEAFSALHLNENRKNHLNNNVKNLSALHKSSHKSSKISLFATTNTEEFNMPISSSSNRKKVNKFQSDLYQKPVVFVGCSGQGKEVSRIASLLDTVIDGSNEDLNMDLLMAQIDQGTLDKNKSILLDFHSKIIGESPSIKKHMLQLLESLYQHDFLVIYINIHPEASKMDSSTQNLKRELESIFIEFSDYELCMKDEGLIHQDNNTTWENMEWQLHRLLARAFLPLATPGSLEPSYNTAHLTMGKNAFFLSLSFPQIEDSAPYIEAMCQDVDAMEFRTDLLSCRDDRFELLYSLQKLREMCRPHATRAPMLPYLGEVIDDSVPVVYTVRTSHQAGTYPDDKDGIAKMFQLLELGLRGGTEVLDVESAWDPEKTNAILSMVEDRYASQILGSHHVVGEKITDEEAIGYFQKCALDGRAHGAKVVLSIEDEEDDEQALNCAMESQRIAAENGLPVIPHIGLILGSVGKYSRVLNLPFTPVTHESLPFVAAPGQMTASELMTTRLVMGIAPPLRYGILGHNISYSVSPAMQGSAFAATKLPHSYCLIDMEDVEEFVKSDLWNDPAFGGCSVTIPHKQSIIPHLDELSNAAKEIGAVNTVIVKKKSNGGGSTKRIMIGDNTDWRGIYNPLYRKLSSTMSSSSDGKVFAALILGGGGTSRAAAYAAKQLGLETVYYNRTPEKAQELASVFGGNVVSSLEQDGSMDCLGRLLERMNGQIQVVISTLPAAVEFQLPEWFVSSCTGTSMPIIFDVNYKPYWTKLLEQADASGFSLVRGSDMLWEQGVGQFELWTGRTAPYKVMKEVVLHNCMPQSIDSE